MSASLHPTPPSSLHAQNNCFAHHESLPGLDIEALHRDLIDLAGFLDPLVGEYITSQTAVTASLSERPAVGCAAQERCCIDASM